MSIKKVLKVTEKDLKEYVVQAKNDSTLCRDVLMNMFDWKMPIPKRFFEELLIANGACAFWLYSGSEEDIVGEGDLIVTSVRFLGDINVYGIGKDAYCVTKNGKGYTFENWATNDDVVICFNNYAWNGDYEAVITQEMLDESNISINCDTKGTRYSKIFKAKNETEKANIEAVNRICTI